MVNLFYTKKYAFDFRSKYKSVRIIALIFCFVTGGVYLTPPAFPFSCKAIEY